jgi:hypothetical protein
VTIKERILSTDASRWAALVERVISADDPERECQVVAAEGAARVATLAASASPV